MTSLTGSTAQTLAGTVDFPSLPTVFGGCAFQLISLGLTWAFLSPLEYCLDDGFACEDPWSRLFWIHAGVILLVWLYSLRTIPIKGTSDPSIVDRLWSNLPYIYTIALAYWKPSVRLYVMAVCSTTWGVRLTTNFVLKGGFSGGEDYRWIEVRKWFAGAPWYFSFEMFNFCFVVVCQLLIILGFTSPAVLDFYDARPFNVLDVAALTVFAVCFTIEAVADYQMLQYQTEKYRRITNGESLGEYTNGFIESGLWAYSRHPNYFGELGMWWAYYLFGVAASGSWLNWTLVGPIFLNLLFLPPGASLDLTEALSSRKYSTYAEYQQRVSRIVPWPPSASGPGAAAGMV